MRCCNDCTGRPGQTTVDSYMIAFLKSRIEERKDVDFGLALDFDSSEYEIFEIE